MKLEMFYIIPLFACLCNAFLLLSFLGVKKGKLVVSFMLLLLALTLWPLGSFLMRIAFFPGVSFWYQVSMISIICTPPLIYIFIYNFSDQTGRFLVYVCAGITVILCVLCTQQVFITNPTVSLLPNGDSSFSYEIRWPSVFLVLFSALELFAAGRLIYISITHDGLPASSFRPLILGVGIMFLAMLLDIIPGLAATFPLDPFACMVNAMLIYYMLCKRRLFSVTQFASSGSTYLVSAVITALTVLAGYNYINSFFSANFAISSEYRTLAMAVFYSVITLLVFLLLKRLANNLFVKKQQAKELTLRDFSAVINRTLKQKEIIDAFSRLINEHTDVQTAYIFTADDHGYKMLACTDSMRATDVSFDADCAMLRWMRDRHTGIDYPSFKRTVYYKGMWEREKTLLEQMQIGYILPILSDDTLTGFVLLSRGKSRQGYSYQEIAFLESVITVLTVSLKNSELYEAIRLEAQMDSLTNVVNRRRFTQLYENTFRTHEKDAITLVLLSFDDFKLYNELYGNEEGDLILQRFAQVLKTVVGTRGIIGRYGGKEFAVCLPVCTSDVALEYVEQIRGKLKTLQESSSESIKRFLTFSAGICTYPMVASSAQQLLTFVNMAIYIAKNSGKNRSIVYTRESEKSVDGDGRLTSTKMEDIAKQYASTIYALTAAIDAKDHYTFSHSNNVSNLATQLARCAGLNDEYVEIIRQAGLFHDIGKIGVPEAILTKQGRLEPEEYAEMKKHVENAIAIIRHLPSLDYVIPVAIAHHERYDGKGYPRGLSGENIPLGGRCLAIADSFDAIVSERPYKAKKSVEFALGEISSNLGTQFDPELGKVFVDSVHNGTIHLNP